MAILYFLSFCQHNSCKLHPYAIVPWFNVPFKQCKYLFCHCSIHKRFLQIYKVSNNQIYKIWLLDLLRLFSLLIHPPMMISWWWEAACTLAQTLLNKPELQINSFEYLRFDYMIPVIFMILAFSLNFNFGQNISHNIFINMLPPNWY